MGSGSSGLVNCYDGPFDTLLKQKTTGTLIYPVCKPCPATLYESCNNIMGPEWGQDSSVAMGAGCQLQCSRIGYTNLDPSTCCLGIQSSNTNITCDPTLVPSSVRCQPTMTNWCMNGKMTDAICTSLPYYNTILNQYCNSVSNIKNNSICSNYIISNPGKFDSIMTQYCSAYPNDDICCLMRSTIPCPNKFDIRCESKAGYQTSSMIATQCPSMLTCNQYINLGSAQQFASNVEENCVGTTNSTSNNWTTTLTQLISTIFSYLTNIYVIILIIVLAVIYVVMNNE